MTKFEGTAILITWNSYSDTLDRIATWNTQKTWKSFRKCVSKTSRTAWKKNFHSGASNACFWNQIQTLWSHRLRREIISQLFDGNVVKLIIFEDFGSDRISIMLTAYKVLSTVNFKKYYVN